MGSDLVRSTALLDRVYADLDLVGGSLHDAAAIPRHGDDPATWREVGDWLLLAERVGAQRVFFVNDDPVLVFSALPDGASERDVMVLYRRAWSLARPRCLFVAVDGELRVYALGQPPMAPGDSRAAIEPIEVVRRTADVADALGRFHRDRLESGAAFEDPEVAAGAGRADQRLLRDVRGATDALVDSGLAAPQAHALIERAILVRYLEDRGVLTDRYFEELFDGNPSWQALLADSSALPDFGSPSRFVRCLGDRDLTYALFERLAHDFNGDLFVPDADELELVAAHHLRLLRDLLRVVVGSAQGSLFLWAYDFGVVPTSLVSTMYELFYRQEIGGLETSTYYTPPQLVEFVLADVLHGDALDREPSVCDPACGSGIFLVEAYRRIVRHESAREAQALSSRRLRELLLGRIAGCDIDESAVRLAAFSLYIAFLNYQTPQDIQSAGPLPPLIQRAGTEGQRTPLIVADAFLPTSSETLANPKATDADRLPWPPHSFDIVVGNPPWTEPRSAAKSLGERWAAQRKLPIGDRSPSQLFLWRALDLLTGDGVAALLVSAKVVFNTRTTSKAFRQQWLGRARVERAVNFSQVRRDYFEKGVAPFMLLRFRRADASSDGPIVYETARPVSGGRRGSPALARLDRRIVSQSALRTRDYLWKTYSAGNHRDDALLSRLELEGQLRDLAPQAPRSQYGFQRAKQDEPAAHVPAPEWSEMRSLATFRSWGPLVDDWFEPLPEYVKFAPDPRLFDERRLLVRRGVAVRFGPHARLESTPFAFRHTTYAVPLGHRPAWEAKVALGTVLSSLGRYWLYMVSGSWGTWNDEIRAEDLLNMPLRLGSPDDGPTRRIVAVVDTLPDAEMDSGQLFTDQGVVRPDATAVLRELNDAVADLFELTTAERDLVEDFWAAQQKGADRRLPEATGTDAAGTLNRYIEVFRQAWAQLTEAAEFACRVWREPRAGVMAVVFETRSTGERDVEPEDDLDEESWRTVLGRLGDTLDERRTGTLLAYGIVRAVTDTAIVIVKRDEQRMWTATAARDDAEATIAQAMALQRA